MVPAGRGRAGDDILGCPCAMELRGKCQQKHEKGNQPRTFAQEHSTSSVLVSPSLPFLDALCVLMLLARATQAAPRRPGGLLARTKSTLTGRRKKVVILGSGWGGNRLARRLDQDIYDVTMVSPANHFLVTPLLPQTALGTLEFRNVQESVRTIKGIKYFQAKARGLDWLQQSVDCEECISEHRPNGHKFSLNFDLLAIATGCKTDTFNIPGVAEAEGREVHFLKHVSHAIGIRKRLNECFERAAMPGISPSERSRLLSFVVVGGGPTSCEFTTELHDFLRADASTWAYPELAKDVRVTLVEAGARLMPAFDATLVTHMMQRLVDRGVSVRVNTLVKALEEDAHGCTNVAVLGATAGGGEVERLPFGLLVWSAGLQQVKFVQNMYSPSVEIQKDRTGRILVDDHMRVLVTEASDDEAPTDDAEYSEWVMERAEAAGSTTLLGGRVYAIGDCAANETAPLPPTAQVAEQQADYLAASLNQGLLRDVKPNAMVPLPEPLPPSSFPPIPSMFYSKSRGFQYVNRGSMSSAGIGDGLVDMTRIARPDKDGKPASMRGPTLTGAMAFTAWHGYYFSKQYQSFNVLLNVVQSLKSRLFRRDISRF